MKNTLESGAFTGTDRRIAHIGCFPELTYFAVPVLDQYDASETYNAFNDRGLEAVPQALVAYADFHQCQWL
jgi:hypothetical protein